MKKILISIFTLFFVISMITTVNAASASINIGASSESVIKGKTFTVTVAGTADNNITGLKSNLSYDSSKLSIESKTPGAGFADMSGANEISIGKTNAENLSKSVTLYTITFKVLDNALEGDTTISVSNAKMALVNESSEQEDVEVQGSADVTIKIKADDTTADNQGGNTDQPGTEQPKEENKQETTTPSNNDNTNNKPSSNTNKNTNTNKKPSKLPQTGVEDASIIAIVALAGVSIASYVSYKKYKNI